MALKPEAGVRWASPEDRPSSPWTQFLRIRKVAGETTPADVQVRPPAAQYAPGPDGGRAVSAGKTRADGPTEGRKQRLRRSTATYRTPLWLLGLGILLGLLAYVIYPEDAQVAGGDAVHGIIVFADFTPSEIVAAQTPDPHVNGFSLQIVLHAAQSALRRPHSGTITIALPGTAWGSNVRCPKPAYYCRPHDLAGLKEASYHLPQHWDTGPNEPAPYRYELRTTITVSDVGSNLSRNAEYVAVLIPPISFQKLVSGSNPYAQVESVYAERVPDDGYSWITGQTPDYVNGFDRWTTASAGALQDAAGPTLGSGIDLAVQSRNGNLQFIAGIVLGVAGAALVGSLQEFLNRRRKATEGEGVESA